MPLKPDPRRQCFWFGPTSSSRRVNAAGHTIAFRSGERLHTENSHKFTIDSFAQLAARAGWSVANTWISDEPRVAMFRLEPHP
jgi:uncharacterized SAM-dependent methyltransferase